MLRCADLQWLVQVNKTHAHLSRVEMKKHQQLAINSQLSQTLLTKKLLNSPSFPEKFKMFGFGNSGSDFGAPKSGSAAEELPECQRSIPITDCNICGATILPHYNEESNRLTEQSVKICQACFLHRDYDAMELLGYELDLEFLKRTEETSLSVIKDILEEMDDFEEEEESDEIIEEINASNDDETIEEFVPMEEEKQVDLRPRMTLKIFPALAAVLNKILDDSIFRYLYVKELFLKLKEKFLARRNKRKLLLAIEYQPYGKKAAKEEPVKEDIQKEASELTPLIEEVDKRIFNSVEEIEDTLKTQKPISAANWIYWSVRRQHERPSSREE